MKRRRCLFLLVLLVLSGCRANAPAPQPVVHRESVYELEMHSFQAEETDVTFVFHKGKALLIDCSTKADPKLIEAYLKAHSISEPAYILSASEVPADIACGAVYTADAVSGTSFTFGDSRISASEGEKGTEVQLQYKGATFRFPLSVQTSDGDTVETAYVTIIKPSADGVQSQMRRESLREILKND